MLPSSGEKKTPPPEKIFSPCFPAFACSLFVSFAGRYRTAHARQNQAQKKEKERIKVVVGGVFFSLRMKAASIRRSITGTKQKQSVWGWEETQFPRPRSSPEAKKSASPSRFGTK